PGAPVIGSRFMSRVSFAMGVLLVVGSVAVGFGRAAVGRHPVAGGVLGRRAVAAERGGGVRGHVGIELVAGRSDQVPVAPLVLHVVAGGAVGAGVGRVAVQRVAVVGDLQRAVVALDGAEQRRVEVHAARDR